MKSNTSTRLVRVDSRFADYLAERSQREHKSIVAITRAWVRRIQLQRIARRLAR